MLPVIYSMSVSLDGFNARPTGDIGWTAPDAEQFRFHIEQTRHVAAHLCGRGLYQEMLVWETAEQTVSGEAELEFARIWRPIPKVVFSPDAGFSGGQRAAGHRRHRRRGRPTRDQPGEGVVSIVGGAGLAAAAIAEDLIDEYRQFVNPIILGGGTPYFTPLAKPLGLRLTESLTFSAGVVYLRCQRTR
jgi:dihydrofolate reductase